MRDVMKNEKMVVGTVVEKPFSLVELLVVIGIIALLASLIFPAISMVKENARKTQAMAMASNLVMAIKQYETTYGLLPVSSSSFPATPASNEYIKDNTTYDLLIAILSQVDGPNSSDKTKGNLRKTRFIEVPSEYSTTVPYQDPWGNRFRIGIDSDYDKDVEGFASSTLNGTVFVYSLGPDKTDNNGDSVDDVISWK